MLLTQVLIGPKVSVNIPSHTEVQPCETLPSSSLVNGKEEETVEAGELAQQLRALKESMSVSGPERPSDPLRKTAFALGKGFHVQ